MIMGCGQVEIMLCAALFSIEDASFYEMHGNTIQLSNMSVV